MVATSSTGPTVALAALPATTGKAGEDWMREGVPINGRVLAELRWLAGLDQIDLANVACAHAWLQADPAGDLGLRVRGEEADHGQPQRHPQALKHALEAKGLELGPAELRALYRPRTLDGASLNGSTGEEDQADRRQATRVVAGGLAALFPLEAVNRITHHGTRPVDSKLLIAHEHLADTLAELHRTMRPDALLGQVVHQADVMLRLLDRPMTDADRQRLDVLRVRALAVARILHTLIVTGGRGGNSHRALALMRGAADYARRADPVTRACAYRWLGLDLAAAGDERGDSRAERIDRVRGVRASFPANWAPLPCVAELDERLRLLTP